MSAGGDGDKRVAVALAAEGVPAPGKKGWTKSIVRGILANPLYDGRPLFGRTMTKVKTVQDGQTVIRKGRRLEAGEKYDARIPAPKNDWTYGVAPRIVDHDLWQKVQSLKSRQRDRYLRADRGHLVGKPEARVHAFMNGLAKCGVCGGSMAYTHGKSKRYYCTARQRATTCTNSRGVPVAELDRTVQERLREKLTEEVIDRLLRDREAKVKAALDKMHTVGADAEKEAARLEAEIARLVQALAAGTASPDVTAAINERRAKVDALRARPAAPMSVSAERERQARLTLRSIRKTFELADHQNIVRDPTAARQALRALDVDKVVVTPDGDGWNIEGLADLERLVLGSNRGPAPSETSPRTRLRGPSPRSKPPEAKPSIEGPWVDAGRWLAVPSQWIHSGTNLDTLRWRR